MQLQIWLCARKGQQEMHCRYSLLPHMCLTKFDVEFCILFTQNCLILKDRKTEPQLGIDYFVIRYEKIRECTYLQKVWQR